MQNRSYQCPVSRWKGLGPYYAMFPVDFADDVIDTYTKRGDVVLDPFAGRGTAVFSAATRGRTAIGVEINPVGYVYARAKLSAADQAAVLARVQELGRLAAHYREDAYRLPRFFHRCFARGVRRFLVAARANLNWRHSRVDRTVMALLLVYLHGKRGAALSNQMRQTKSMSPPYAIRWWDEFDLDPPDLDPVTFMTSRIEWRYARGTPATSRSEMRLGDSAYHLPRIARRIEAGEIPRVNLLFTSPPYFAVTNYHYDQWLRLWLLGGPATARLNGNGRGGKFEGRDKYRQLLERVFKRAAPLLAADATLYVRTDARTITYTTTVAVLKEIFPSKRLTEVRQPLLRPSQTGLFGPTNETNSVGEVDLVLAPQ